MRDCVSRTIVLFSPSARSEGVGSSRSFVNLPVPHPLPPMLAALHRALPGEGYVYEPKWDGFRALVYFDAEEARSTRAGEDLRRVGDSPVRRAGFGDDLRGHARVRRGDRASRGRARSRARHRSDAAPRARGQVLIDVRQNSERLSTVAAYSLRATDEPSVSTPVTFEELERGDLVFTPTEVLARSDPWA